jgi:hypothetical protein
VTCSNAIPTRTDAALFHPLVYTSVFGDNLELQRLNIMLTSLLEFGDYQGNVAVLSNQPLDAIISYIPPEFRSRLHYVQIDKTDLAPRYLIKSSLFCGYSPILFLDATIVVDNKIDSLLREIIVDDKICVVSESSIYPELAASKIVDVIDTHRIGNWFGLEICRNDPACAQAFLPCASSSIIGFKDSGSFKEIGELISSTCNHPSNKELIRWFGDQPILNYILVRKSAAQTALFTSHSKFAHTWDQDLRVRSGFRHFVWSTSSEKVRHMAAYLEHLRRTRLKSRARDLLVASEPEYSSAVRQRLETSQFIFVVTSALGANQGALEPQARFSQTIRTIQSIREHIPDAFILVVDSSPLPIAEEAKNELRSLVDIAVFIGVLNPGLHLVRDLGGFWKTTDYSKTLAETYSLLHALMMLKVIGIGKTAKRVFKLSGRYYLTSTFKIAEYFEQSLLGKYSFKSRGRAWLPSERGYFDTRLWSFCATLLDETIEILLRVFICTLDASVDAEHAYFRGFPHAKIHELAKIHVAGQIASTGEQVSE